jgi:gamma-glutamyltranspeptidase / glutathione hydrolase
MMTDRWLNYVLAVVVGLGLVGVVSYERPRLAEERAEFLDQEIAVGDPEAESATPVERDPLELRERRQAEDQASDPQEPSSQPLGAHGVSASHPLAVETGMRVLEAGGNAVDAAIAVSYALGVVEPFGSGVGGGGAMLLHRPGEEPLAYDYRETAPLSGELPANNIGVPGFVAGMEHIHAAHGTIALEDLIEPAARYAEDGFEVDDYLHTRTREAAFRMPIHLLPGLFPGGEAIASGAELRQAEYGEVLRTIQDQGAAAMYGGELGQQVAEAVSGLSIEDLEAYEVAELTPAVGSYGDYDVISGAPPISGPPLVQTLQVAEEAGIADLDLDGSEAHHVLAQAFRLAQRDRTELMADPEMVDVPLDQMLARDYTDELAASIPADGFVELPEDEEVRFAGETDTTQVVVVDDEGTMVSLTNTLSNFFGSGLPVAGFFLNDQLKNFSPEADSVNAPEPGKRPRSFITPTILAQDGEPVLGIGSPGGRRIPFAVAQVLVRWAGHGEDLEAAVEQPRFHIEGEELQLEESLPGGVTSELEALGYQVTTTVPTEEYFGGMQALLIDRQAGTIDGAADRRRAGTWMSTTQ